MNCELQSCKAIDIANYIIEYSNYKNYTISNLKLQKLLYLAEVEFLKQNKNSCHLFRENIEEWGFGPVVGCVYENYMCMGGGHIYKPFDIKNFHAGYKVPILPINVVKIVQKIVNKYNKLSNIDLLNLIYAQPFWQSIIKDMDGFLLSKTIISKDDIYNNL